jgi:hypothetical protein
MRRVYFIWAGRTVLTRIFPIAIVLYGLALLLAKAVFWAMVVKNMPAVSHPLAASRFVYLAFLNTEFMVQVVTIVSILSAFVIAREVVRVIARGFSQKAFVSLAI